MNDFGWQYPLGTEQKACWFFFLFLSWFVRKLWAVPLSCRRMGVSRCLPIRFHCVHTCGPSGCPVLPGLILVEQRSGGGSGLCGQDVLRVSMFCKPPCFWTAEGKDEAEWRSSVSWSNIPGWISGSEFSCVTWAVSLGSVSSPETSVKERPWLPRGRDLSWEYNKWKMGPQTVSIATRPG